MKDSLNGNPVDDNKPKRGAAIGEGAFCIIYLLLLLPKNEWFTGRTAASWAIIRNIPFVIIGFLTVFGFINVISNAHNFAAGLYIQVIISVILSFIFYMDVVIYGRKYPKTGMLMIPKTLCYIWMTAVFIFF